MTPCLEGRCSVQLSYGRATKVINLTSRANCQRHFGRTFSDGPVVNTFHASHFGHRRV